MPTLIIPKNGSPLREVISGKRRSIPVGQPFEHPDETRAKWLIDHGLAVSYDSSAVQAVKSDSEPKKRGRPKKDAE